MPETIIRGLITICLVVLCYFLIIWVLGAIGLHLPPMVLNILTVILVLVAILLLFRMLRPYWGQWFP